MKKFLVLFAFLPLLSFAEVPPCPLSLPVVYNLSGALEEGTEVVAIVTDLGEISTFSFDTATSYLNINTDATFYYALCKTASGGFTYLYMGPSEVGGSGEVSIQELEPLPSSINAGAKAFGRGTLISLASGTLIFLTGIAMDDGSGWDAFAGFIIGLVVFVYGTVASAAYGLFKGTQTSLKNNREVQRRAAARMSSSSSGISFVVLPVDESIVPEEYLKALHQL